MIMKEQILRKLENKYNEFQFYIPIYKNQKSKIEITCKKHGIFTKTIGNALNKPILCKECENEKKNIIFIEKLKNIYDNKYDYSLVEYKNSKSDIKLICKKHGLFKQRADYLLNNGGCKLCKSLEKYISISNKIHNKYYDYSLVEYVNAHKKVKIICPEHGVFEQNLVNHSNGQKCPKCSYQNKFNTNEDFIKKAKEIYGNKYDYSLVEYKNSRTKVKIICPEHGVFLITPQNFLYNKTGCYKCSIEQKTLSKIDFINNANQIHNNKYDYSLVEYKNSRTKVKIICPEHGVFIQLPNLHIHKQTGCPKCNSSKNERLIERILIENNIFFETQKKFDNCKNKRELPFDFYLPDFNLCIEYDGEQHFKSISYFGGDEKFIETKKHDEIKTNFCLENNINLLRIRYDENLLEKIFEYFSHKKILLK